MAEDKIAEFVRRKRRVELKEVEIKEVKVPWYKRPIERTAFTIKKAKDGKFYAQHNEWSKRVWIGPYLSEEAVDNIIDSYVMESLKGDLDKKLPNSIHSLTVDDEKTFF
jgi:hypothetical protein